MSDVTRWEDMSPAGALRLVQQNDGDIIVQIVNYYNASLSPEYREASVEFCTFAGGGHSPKTLEALRNLMVAINEDNDETEQHPRFPEPGT